MISVSHAQQTLCAGVEIVDGFMRSHGFLYTPTTAGKSSGACLPPGSSGARTELSSCTTAIPWTLSPTEWDVCALTRGLHVVGPRPAMGK